MWHVRLLASLTAARGVVARHAAAAAGCGCGLRCAGAMNPAACVCVAPLEVSIFDQKSSVSLPIMLRVIQPARVVPHASWVCHQHFLCRRFGYNSPVPQSLTDYFGDLSLEAIRTKAVRVRAHVNPLASPYLRPLEALPDWNSVYADSSRRMVVDVGCAAGRFSLMMSRTEEHKNWNHLGLEIRAPLVERAQVWVSELGITNVHYVACNVTVHLSSLLASYPGSVAMICVQFPDPCFKRKHHRRRVLQTPLLSVFASLLEPGGVLFLQSDIEETCAQMRDRTENCGYFDRRANDVYSPRDPCYIRASDPETDQHLQQWTHQGSRVQTEGDAVGDYGDWLIGGNPLGPQCKTEREVDAELGQLPVYRCIYIRNQTLVPANERQDPAE